MALLARAQDVGLFKDKGQVEQLKNDRDLDLLRPRKDFQHLLRAISLKKDNPAK
jgi:hypothetical protein